jgi:transposase
MHHNVLNLSAYKVLGSNESEHDYHIKAETSNPLMVCTNCRSREVVGYGRVEVLVHDLPMHGKRVGIYVDARRFKCKSCSKTFMEHLPEVNANRWMTERLVKWVGQRSLTNTFTSIAEEIGVTEGTIRNVFSDYVTELERTIRFETPKWMGIDEIHIIQKPRAVISNLHNNTAVNLLPNRNKKTIATYLSNLKDKHTVQYVAMDMWRPYREAVNDVIPDAKVVVDKFHVVRMANVAMESVRKSLRADLSPKQRRGLMHDRFVLLRRQSQLTDQESFNLDGWTKNYPLLGEAYRLKEDFFNIYQASSKQQAQIRYEQWLKSIPAELRGHYEPIITAWSNWQTFILEYFNHPITNAYTESLNSLIRVLNRLGRGYSFEALRAKILFSRDSHKIVQNRPKFERREAQYDTAPMEFALFNNSPSRLEKPKNYGVDIDKLVLMIERGEI